MVDIYMKNETFSQLLISFFVVQGSAWLEEQKYDT